LPEVSVIIPNYNHAAFLERRIASVLNQTYSDFELIILDDDSTDNSSAIIDVYKMHPKISHIVYNDQNSGSGFLQWKKGINLAKGKYIWIAESDDVNEPDFLETMMSLLAPEKKCKIAFSASQTIDTKGNPIRPYEFKFDNGIDSNHDWIAAGEKFCREILCKYNVLLNASSVVFEKKLYEEAGGINTKYRICSDWLLWWEMISRSNVAFSGKKLNYYCVHQANTSSNWVTELRITYKYILSHWPFAGGREEYKKYLNDYALSLHYRKKHKTAFAISSCIGMFALIKNYLLYLMQGQKKVIATT
jgi:glycosyltransferase involved in cell wall biosynthesis